MKVKEFLLHKTRACELCIICDSGYVVAAVWVDPEDLFTMNNNIANQEVIGDKWGKIETVDAEGKERMVTCHYIDIE